MNENVLARVKRSLKNHENRASKVTASQSMPRLSQFTDAGPLNKGVFGSLHGQTPPCSNGTTGRMPTFILLGFAESFTIHQFAFLLANCIGITPSLLFFLFLYVCDLKKLFFHCFSGILVGNEYAVLCSVPSFTCNFCLYSFAR